MGRRNEICRASIPRHAANDVLHRFAELAETNGIFQKISGVRHSEGLVIGKEIVWLGKVGFGLQVVATMNRLIGALEKPLLTVLYELDGCGFDGLSRGGQGVN